MPNAGDSSVPGLSNFQPDHREPWSTEWQVANTLEAMGVRVVRAQEIGKEAVGWGEIERLAAEEAPDLFLWTQTTNTDPDGAYRCLDRLADLGVPSASYHLDLYWGINRQHQIYEHPFWRTDFVFTADGGHPHEFRRARVNHYWAEPAVYEPNAVVGDRRAEYAFRIVFTGSHPYPHEEHRLARTQMITWVKARYGGSRFRVFRGGIRNQDFTDLCASATVVLGDSCLAGKIPYYWSERVPETLSRGGFLVHPWCPGIDESYTDGEHLRLFEPGDMLQLGAILDHYLDHPDEARQVGGQGRRHVLTRHLFSHRLADVFATVGISAPVGAGA